MANEEKRNRRDQEIGEGAVDRRQHIDQALIYLASELAIGKRIECVTLPVSERRHASEEVKHGEQEACDDNVDD